MTVEPCYTVVFISMHRASGPSRMGSTSLLSPVSCLISAWRNSRGPETAIATAPVGAVRTGAGQNTLRRLALFLYLNHPTTNDVTSGQNRSKIGAALVSVELKSEVSVECDFFVFVNQHFHGILL